MTVSIGVDNVNAKNICADAAFLHTSVQRPHFFHFCGVQLLLETGF